MKRFLGLSIIIFFFTLSFSMSSCQSTQENQIIGIWEMIYMDRLPLTLPRTQWEFTADNKILHYHLPENNQRILRSSGGYSFNKGNKFEVFKFDKGYNGEWTIVKINGSMMRIILKEFVNDQPAGQTLMEFSKVF